MEVKYCALILTILFAFISIPAIAQTPLKIVAVDTEKAIEESIWGKKTIEELGKEREEWQKKLDQLKGEIGPLEEKLAKQRAFLDDKEAENKLLSEIDEKKMGLELLIRQGNDRLAEKQEELLSPILEELRELIKRLSIKEGYDIVLEKRLIVLYLKPELDITSRVTVMLDEIYKEKVANEEKEPVSEKKDEGVQ